MFKKMQFTKIIFYSSLVLGIIGTAFSGYQANAASINAGVLSIDYAGAPGPLFSATNIAPGYSETKALTVKNNGKVPHSFSIAVSGTLGSLADVLIIEPKVLGSVVWSKTISGIVKYPDSNVIVGSIAPGGTANVDITASLPSGTGNAYQGTTTLSFDFIVGNEITDSAEPVAGVAGGGVVQRTIRRIRNAVVGTGGETAPATVAPSNDTTPSGQVAGASTESSTKGEESNGKPVCYWWWILLIVLAAFLGFWGYLSRKREIIFAWVWPIFAAAVLYLVHWILHDYYTPSKWCPYFIWYELILLVLYYIAVATIPEKAQEEKGS